MRPDDYWLLGEGETMGIITGHQKIESYDAEKFRNIYGAMIRYMGEKGNVKSFWPLPTDNAGGGVTREYLDKRNADALKIAERLGILKGEC